MKPFAVLLCTLLLVTSLTACGWVTITDGPAPSASNSAASDNDVTEEEPQPSSDVVVTAEDAADIISGMEADILKLDNLNISDVQIIAVHDMQIVGTN